VFRIDPLGLYDYNAQETQELLDYAVWESSQQNRACAFFRAARDIGSLGGVGKYDFGKRSPTDTFVVPGLNDQVLNAPDFGNYFAGYVSYGAFGDAGLASAHGGGWFWAFFRGRSDPMTPWGAGYEEGGDQYLISAGIANYMGNYGPGGYGTSPCQCSR
jgi:hypothetical protein